MKSLAETPKTARVIVLNNRAEARQAMAVLEQMYGYFSFEPMPLEAEERAAA